MRLCKPVSETEVTPEPAWIVRYTALIDSGETGSWEETYSFKPSRGQYVTAGDLLVAGWGGRYRHGMVIGDVFYPPHRIQQITWELR